MKYSKKYIEKNAMDTIKAYDKEINVINNMLASGFYAYNSKILKDLRNRKGKLYRRILSTIKVEYKRYNLQ